MTYPKKSWAAIGLMIIATTAIAACTPQEVREIETIVEVEVTREVEVEVAPEPVSEQSVLRIVAEEDWGGAESIDPASASRDIPSIKLLYSQMIRLDKENFSSPTPDLIESWEPDATGLTWTLHVRQGVTFHDGTPLTAADIIYTIRHIADPEVGSPVATTLAIIDVDRLEAPDDHTVILHLNNAHSDFPLLMTDYRIRVIKDGSADDPDSPDYILKTGIGTGPFMLDTYDLDTVTTFNAFPDYWEGTPGVDRVEVLRISDTDAWVRAMLAGQVDFLRQGSVKNENMPLFQGADDFVIHSFASGEWANLAMNVNLPPFDDVRVMQAMKLVVDRQEMMDVIVGGQGVIACDTPVWPGDPYYLEQTCEQDIDGAIALLAEAGYPDGLDVVLTVSTANPWMIPMAVVYKEQAALAGIRVEISEVPSDGYWSDTWRVMPFVGSHWGERNADQALSEIFSCESTNNETYYCSEEFDQILLDARSELDFDKRQALFQAAQLMVREESGVINPFFRLSNRILSTRVGGIDPGDRDYYFHLITVGP